MFTVFDGHGKEGDLCAVFCKETLPGVLSTDLRGSRTVEEGLQKAFNRTNVQVGRGLVSTAVPAENGWDRSIHSSIRSAVAPDVYVLALGELFVFCWYSVIYAVQEVLSESRAVVVG